MAVESYLISGKIILARSFYAPDYSVLIPTWRSKKIGVFGGSLQKVDQRDGAGGGSTLNGEPYDKRKYGYIERVVKEESAPTSVPVHCLESTTLRVVRSGWSNDKGIIRFEDLDPAKTFTLIAEDISRKFNHEIIGRVKPTPYYGEAENG